MDKKEKDWNLHKVGFISASIVKDLNSKSGKWTEGNIDCLYEIQQQRVSGEPKPPISARPTQLGIENEPYGIEWIRTNKPEMNILHCDKDFNDKIFEVPFENLKFGVSPDAFVINAISSERSEVYAEYIKSQIYALLEVKCVIGRKMQNRYFSPTLPFENKKEMAKEEHIDQLAAQMLAYPDVQKIYLLKYLPQIDENPWDLRDVLDPSRGILFEFSRAELAPDISRVEMRIRYADAYLNSGKDLELINTLKIEI